MSFSIQGKTAIVTGGANGCGLAIGRHFLSEGANVVFADLDREGLERELGDTLIDDGPARLYVGDLCEKLAVANLISMTIDAFDRVDILVNGARQIIPVPPLEASFETVEAAIHQNLLCPLRLSQAVAKQMIKQGTGSERGCYGTIVNLSSIAARRTQPELLGYSVAAAGVEQMTRSMAVSLAAERIRVNAVAFGSLMSASLRKVLRDDKELRKRVVEATPLGRVASAGELVHTVQYLASDASSFTTGQVITVDGGRTLIDPVSCPSH